MKLLLSSAVWMLVAVLSASTADAQEIVVRDAEAPPISDVESSINYVEFEPISLGSDQSFHQKQRRQNVLGWTLVAVGVVVIASIPIIVRNGDSIQDPEARGGIAAGTLGLMSAAAGTSVLAARRSRAREHRHRVYARPTLTGVQGRF